jgi:hypothetical protein
MGLLGEIGSAAGNVIAAPFKAVGAAAKGIYNTYRDHDRDYNSQYQTLGGNNKVMFDKETAAGSKDVGLANSLKPVGGSALFDVVKDYPWTLSKKAFLDEIPYIYLTEYKISESALRRQAAFYAKGVIPDTLTNSTVAAGRQESMFMYSEIVPKDTKTNLYYKFPYFNKTGFQLEGSWKAQQEIGESAKGLIGETGNAIANAVKAGANFIMGAAKNYPQIGIVDRPQIFESHSSRSLNVTFTLFNTVEFSDWRKNRELAYTLISQNLFNKRDYITGVPPVFYDVWIPGQYYSYASAMVDIQVNQIGNQRLLEGIIVPDAYEFNLTLRELCFPSKNQLEAVTNGYAEKNILVKEKNR